MREIRGNIDLNISIDGEIIPGFIQSIIRRESSEDLKTSLIGQGRERHSLDRCD